MKILGSLFKKQSIISLTLILSIVAITMYSSYASLFKLDPVSIAKAHETDNLRITFGNNGYDQQIHSQVLTSFKDEEAVSSKNIKPNNIYITNESDHDIRFKLYLQQVLPDDSIKLMKDDKNYILDSKYIKYQINNQKVKMIEENTNGLILIDTAKYGLDIVNKIVVKVWVSDEAKLLLSDKEIHLKFVIEEVPQNGYGEESSLANVILMQNEGIKNITQKTIPDYTNAAINKEGVFLVKDDLGDSFYYRGSANNNVLFGKDINGSPIEWKIVRINGDKSIRIILSEKNLINYPSLLNKYLDNSIINNWFDENLSASFYNKFVVDNLFCDHPEISLLCLNDSNRLFIGLLSEEEALLAGSSVAVSNSLYYLSQKDDMWLMNTGANAEKNLSYLSRGKILFTSNNNLEKYLRPVINIKGNLIVQSGDGSVEAPFILDLQLNEE